MPTRKSTLESLAHVFAPLGVGGVIYVGYRGEDLRFVRWAHALGLDGARGALRDRLIEIVSTLPDVVRYSVPDALWTYGLSYGVAYLSRSRLALAIPLAFGPGAEVLQAFGVVPGVFDPLDLVACGLAVALGVGAGMFRRRRDHDEEPMDASNRAVLSDRALRGAGRGDVTAAGR